MHLRFLDGVDMKIGVPAGLAYRCVVVEVSSDWSKIDDKAMPILGRFALAKRGPPRSRFPPSDPHTPFHTLMIGPLVPYIRPKRKGPTRGMR
jgi:hypothetical protein